jgi:hypothetical protein
LGYVSQGEDWRFTGFVIGVEDGNSYIANMLSGSEGDWLYRSPYSTVKQRGIIAFLPYIILGKLTSQPAQHEQMVALYQLYRIIGIFLMVLASYDFLSIFFKRDNHKWWALVLIILGGGAGWILVIFQQKNFFGSVPLEFISPESFGFLAILGFPHLAVARALFLWGLKAYIKEENAYNAGLFWLFLGLFQPLYILVAWIVITAHFSLLLIINLLKSTKTSYSHELIKGVFIRWILSIVLSSPIAIYTAYGFITDPFLKGWNEQNVLSSPHFVHYLFAYGLILPIALLGLKKILAEDYKSGIFLASWLVILPILVSLPINSQRRMSEGIWIVFVICAIEYIASNLNIWKSAYLFMFFPSTIILIMGSIMTATQPREPAFQPASEINLYNELGKFANDRPVVMSSFQTGNNLPAWIPVKVVWGHGPLSINRQVIDNDLQQFFSEETENDLRSEILKKYQVEYLVWGPSEREYWNWNPKDYSVMKLIYNDSGYFLYEIQNGY